MNHPATGPEIQAIRNRRKEDEEAAARIAQANAALMDAITRAAKEREKQTLATPPAPGGGPGVPLTGAGAALGTFNAAVAGLLGRSGADIQERIATATERTAEGVEDLKDAVEDIDLVATD